MLYTACVVTGSNAIYDYVVTGSNAIYDYLVTGSNTICKLCGHW